MASQDRYSIAAAYEGNIIALSIEGAYVNSSSSYIQNVVVDPSTEECATFISEFALKPALAFGSDITDTFVENYNFLINATQMKSLTGTAFCPMLGRVRCSQDKVIVSLDIISPPNACSSTDGSKNCSGYPTYTFTFNGSSKTSDIHTVAFPTWPSDDNDACTPTKIVKLDIQLQLSNNFTFAQRKNIDFFKECGATSGSVPCPPSVSSLPQDRQFYVPDGFILVNTTEKSSAFLNDFSYFDPTNPIPAYVNVLGSTYPCTQCSDPATEINRQRTEKTIGIIGLRNFQPVDSNAVETSSIPLIYGILPGTSTSEPVYGNAVRNGDVICIRSNNSTPVVIARFLSYRTGRQFKECPNMVGKTNTQFTDEPYVYWTINKKPNDTINKDPNEIIQYDDTVVIRSLQTYDPQVPGSGCEYISYGAPKNTPVMKSVASTCETFIIKSPRNQSGTVYYNDIVAIRTLDKVKKQCFGIQNQYLIFDGKTLEWAPVGNQYNKDQQAEWQFLRPNIPITSAYVCPGQS